MLHFYFNLMFDRPPSADRWQVTRDGAARLVPQRRSARRTFILAFTAMLFLEHCNTLTLLYTRFSYQWFYESCPLKIQKHMCVYVYIYVYKYMHIYLYIKYTYTYVYTCKYTYTNIYVYIYTHLYICLCIFRRHNNHKITDMRNVSLWDYYITVCPGNN